MNSADVKGHFDGNLKDRQSLISEANVEVLQSHILSNVQQTEK